MKMADSTTILVGLIGSGIRDSLSPALHERAGARCGYRYTYRLIDLQVLGHDVSALPSLLESAEREGFRGLNITHPCKQLVIPHLDELSESARIIGAVNTVVFRDGRRIGYNTDGSGFARAFREGANGVKLGRIVQLGAGGAGAAVAHAMLDIGARCVMLVDIVHERAAHLASQLCQHFGLGRAVAVDDISAVMASADGLVHATPTGMLSHPGLPLAAELIQSRHWVAEIVYFPLATPLLKLARSKGCMTIDGGGMAVYQAVGAFELFTGIEPDAVQMRQHFDELVATRAMQPTADHHAAQQ